MLELIGEGNLLMNGTASNTQEVAGAVSGVGQVGRGGVSWGTVNSLLTLRSHEAEAETPSVSSTSHISELRLTSAVPTLSRQGSSFFSKRM